MHETLWTWSTRVISNWNTSHAESLPTPYSQMVNGTCTYQTTIIFERRMNELEWKTINFVSKPSVSLHFHFKSEMSQQLFINHPFCTTDLPVVEGEMPVDHVKANCICNRNKNYIQYLIQRLMLINPFLNFSNWSRHSKDMGKRSSCQRCKETFPLYVFVSCR